MGHKISKNFSLTEFIPKEVYKELGGNSYKLIDPRIYKLAQSIRDYLGSPMTINNWTSRGEYNNRGYRTFDCKVGSSLSQHKFGRAIDFHCPGIDPIETQKILIRNRDLICPDITFFEIDINWVHIDVRAIHPVGSFQDILGFYLWSPTRGFVDYDVWREETA